MQHFESDRLVPEQDTRVPLRGLDAHLPLRGLRVLDLTRALSGPYCASLLGDLGADVVKVETPTGDMIRAWGPFDEDVSLYHLSVNRNKRSISLDLRHAEGQEALKRLVAVSDVVLENFRPGVLDQLGIGAAWIEAHHPEVIVASISGFGAVGPLSDEPAFDQVAQGIGGLMSVTGTQQSGPLRSGVPLADILSGMFAALGVCAALAGRGQARPARRVETSLLESVIGVLTFQAQRYLSLGEIPQPTGNEHPIIAPYGAYQTADGPLNLAVGTAQQWESLCLVVEDEALAHDTRFLDGNARHLHRAELADALEARLRSKPRAAWIKAMRAARIPAGPINDMAETFADAQVQALGMVELIDHPRLGPTNVLRGPLRFSGEPVHVRLAPPELGQHTVEVLQEAGFSADAADDLVSRGIAFAFHTESEVSLSRTSRTSRPGVSWKSRTSP